MSLETRKSTCGYTDSKGKRPKTVGAFGANCRQITAWKEQQSGPLWELAEKKHFEVGTLRFFVVSLAFYSPSHCACMSYPNVCTVSSFSLLKVGE